MSKPASPTKLTVGLSFVMVIVVGLGVAGFIYSKNLLQNEAQETAKISAKAASSNEEIQSLTSAQVVIDKNKDVELKAANLASDSTSYLYQNRITTDISSIASRAGVEVDGIDFATTSAAATATTTPPVTSILTGGVRETTFNVTVKNPVRYDKLMAFIRYIEQNSNKMQISKVSITSIAGAQNGAGMVTSDIFTVSVYVR